MSHTLLLLGACGAGVAFSCIGIGYRLGQKHGVPACHVALSMGIVGTLYFCLDARHIALASVPWIIWIAGAVVGITQWFTTRLVQMALRRGPLTPAWCAVGLNFLLPAVYVALFLNEWPDLWQWLGLGTGAATVVVAALNAEPQTGQAAAQRSARDIVIYGLLLLAIIVANSANPIALKHLANIHAGGTQTVVQAYGAVYYVMLYLFLGLGLLGDLLVTGELTRTSRFVFAAGGLAAAGSVTGMSLLRACLDLPASILFTVNSAVMILSAALVSALFLGERTRPAWYLTVGLSILTVVLVNLTGLMR